MIIDDGSEIVTNGDSFLPVNPIVKYESALCVDILNAKNSQNCKIEIDESCIPDPTIKNTKQVDRAITKNGVFNFNPTNADNQRRKYLSDLFTTLVEVKWRWTLTAFCFSYFGTWLLFAVGWYLIVYLHGDTINQHTIGWNFCITEIDNFSAAFLFSVETQHTTGYGFYRLTEECPQAIFLFCMQSIVGVILEGLMVGLVFIKITRAKKRNVTLLFSKNAVITSRDGQYHFMFRIGDMRKSNILEARVRAQLIRKKTTLEGEIITYNQEELKVSGEGEMDNKVLLFWPTTVVHKINNESPLFGITEKDLNAYNDSFEIIVVLEGIVESTGLNTQARSSYLPSEILWGQRFQSITSKKSSSGEKIIDYSRFNETFPI